MLSKIEEFKFNRLQAKFGSMSSSEALAIALESEQICKDLKPFDIAFTKFKQDELDSFIYAQLLEKLGK